MAYAYVVSLKQTIERLLKPAHSLIHLTNPEIIESAYEELLSVRQALDLLYIISRESDSEIAETLDILDSLKASHFIPQSQFIHFVYKGLQPPFLEFFYDERWTDLYGPLKIEALDKFENVLQPILSAFLGSCESALRDWSSWLVRERVREGINSFTQTVIKVKEDRRCSCAACTNEEEEDEDDDDDDDDDDHDYRDHDHGGGDDDGGGGDDDASTTAIYRKFRLFKDLIKGIKLDGQS